MVKCHYCETANSDGEKICTGCGMPLPKPIKSSGTNNAGNGKSAKVAFEVYEAPATVADRWVLQCHTCADIFEIKNEDIRTLMTCPFCSKSGRVEHEKLRKRTERKKNPDYPCPRCAGKLRYIEKYKRWYCNACKQYA